MVQTVTIGQAHEGLTDAASLRLHLYAETSTRALQVPILLGPKSSILAPGARMPGHCQYFKLKEQVCKPQTAQIKVPFFPSSSSSSSSLTSPPSLPISFLSIPSAEITACTATPSLNSQFFHCIAMLMDESLESMLRICCR